MGWMLVSGLLEPKYVCFGRLPSNKKYRAGAGAVVQHFVVTLWIERLLVDAVDVGKLVLMLSNAMIGVGSPWHLLPAGA